MDVTHDPNNILLTAGETSELFNTYLNNTASVCVLSYFTEKSKDPEVKLVVQAALDESKKMLNQLKLYFSP